MSRKKTPCNGDIREVAAYGIIEVATYLRLPRKTVEYWVAEDCPIIFLPQIKPPRFSFMNLLECHVLSAMREKGVRLPKIRTAVRTVQRMRPSAYPLLEQVFETDGVDLFIRMLPDDLVNVALGGQLAFKQILDAFLKRIEMGQDGPWKFFPFVTEKKPTEPKIIQIDPKVSFGRPVIAGTGVSTALIAARFAARESIDELAQEYRRTIEEIEEAIRWETATRAIAA